MTGAPMKDTILNVYTEAFLYPNSELLERLAGDARLMPESPMREALLTFLAQAGELSPGEWEELYTRTWDLDPLTAPYIGFHIWGEDYRRGNFLAVMQRTCRAAGVETEGELPDHLTPVLRCILAGCAPEELKQVFAPALEKMAAALREKDETNPYLGLIEALKGLEL